MPNGLLSNDLLPAERRRFPRVQVVGDVQGQVIPFHVGLRVIDVDIDGFAVESAIDFRPETEHSFQFQTSQAVRPVVNAVTVHSRPTRGGRGRPFVAGFSFVRLSAHARDAVEAIIAESMNVEILAGASSPEDRSLFVRRGLSRP